MALGACGPVDDAEPDSPSADGSLDVEAVIARARAGLMQDEGFTSMSLVSPEQPVSTTLPILPQQSSAVAAGNGMYLVAWTEVIDSGNGDVYGVRVRASDGELLDATPLRIATGWPIQHKPAIAFDGTNFLVLWDQLAYGPPQTYGARVRASDGAMLDPVPHHISRAYFEGPPQYNASVAFDGTNFLVIWEGMTRGWYGDYSYAIQGIRVRPSDGKPIESYGFTVARLDNNGVYGVNPKVACGGGRCLTVWPAYTSAGWDIFGARWNASTARWLDTSPRNLTQTQESAEGQPIVASDGSDFLVIWNDSPDFQGVGSLKGSRVSGAEGAVLSPRGFLVGAQSLAPASEVTFDGSDYRVAWQRSQEGVRQLMGTRVTTAGEMTRGAEQVLAQVHASSNKDRAGVAAAGRGRYVVSYSQHDEALAVRRVKWRQVEDLPNGEACTQGASCQSGFCVDGVCCESACGGGVGTDCQACAVAAGGAADGACTVVRAEAAVVCRDVAVACDVAEVCDGASAACPADEPPAREPDLTGDKCEDTPCDVQAYVEALGPEQVEPGFARSLVAKAQGACQSWEQGQTQATRGKLRALLNEVDAQRGRKLSESTADTLAAALRGML